MNQQSAFPFGTISETTGQPVNGYFSEGMTLRDYFAAKAMQSEYHLLERLDQFASCASSAYKMADEMMKARKS